MDVKNEKERKFFDAFTTLRLGEELASLFEDTVIEHIVQNKVKNRLKIFLASGHIITKPQIKTVEREIERQLFRDSGTEVFIFERFELPKQYDLKYIFSEYRDGLFEELKSDNRFIYAALKACNLSLSEDNHIVISADRSLVLDYIEKQISTFLEDVFLTRFNINIIVEYEYKDQQKPKGYISREEREKAEIAYIKQTMATLGENRVSEEQAIDDSYAMDRSETTGNSEALEAGGKNNSQKAKKTKKTKKTQMNPFQMSRNK